ncbi:MAG TPA: DUF2079 domain-containing protein [bacterium]|nr:DUF2079 domain-containing protein [bacterium]
MWGWVFGYTAALSALSILRYHLWVPGDGWIFQQGMWLLLHRGVGAASTYMGYPILADAAQYILVPLAPIYWFGGVYGLLILQAFGFGLGYLFIRRIGSTLSVSGPVSHLLGLVYLIYPAVIGANLFDFHPDALGVPVLFGAMWSALTDRRSAYLILLLASLTIKDTAPVVVAGLGAALLVQRKFVWGVVTVALGLIAAYVDVAIVIPGLSHAPMHQWAYYYGDLGATPGDGVAHLLRDPVLLVSWTHRADAWTCLAFLFGPLVAILLVSRSPALTAWWLPGLALTEINLLSPRWPFDSPYAEMYVLAVPSFFTAMLVLLARGRTRLTRGTAVAWLILPMLSLLVLDVIVYAYWRDRPRDAKVLAAAVAAVPRDAPVITQDFMAAHLADRDREWTVGLLPNHTIFPAGTYVVLDPSHTASDLGNAPAQLAWLRTQVGSGRQTADVTFSQNAVIVYHLLRPLQFP